MAVIDGIEPDQRDEQPPIGLDEGRPEQIPAGGQWVAWVSKEVQCAEKPRDRPFIDWLGCCEARAVHTIIDVLVYEMIQAIDFRT